MTRDPARRRPRFAAASWPTIVLGLGLLAVLLLPLLALALGSSPTELYQALTHPVVLPALALSARTSVTSLAIVVITGTPLAWMLARSRHRGARWLETVLELPIVIPPAVMGVALLLAFGRQGLVGSWLHAWGLSIPFSSTAVVLAQIAVAAPFYVRSAVAGFSAVDEDLLLVARTLGASRTRVLLRIAVPLALPSLLGGAALCWARAVGEFGATLLFAGSFPGTTQTLPLAIYAAFETDVQVAAAIALVLAIAAFAALLLAGALRHRLTKGWSPR